MEGRGTARSRRPEAFVGGFLRNRGAAFGADAAGVASQVVAAVHAGVGRMPPPFEA